MGIQRSPSGNTNCEACGRGIGRDVLRLQAGKSSFYHVSCYRQTQRLPVALLSCSLHCSPEEISALAALRMQVEAWNQQLYATEETLQPVYRSKAVATRAPAGRRLLLETFKYLAVQEVESTVAVVCRDWLHVSREDELWEVLYCGTLPAWERTTGQSYRSLLIAHCQSKCWHCGSLVRLESLRLLCPLRSKPLCVYCSHDENLKLLPVFPFLKRKHVSAQVLDFARLRTVKVHNVTYAYKGDIVAAVLPHAERRKALACAVLKAWKVPALELDLVQQFSVQWFYGLRWSRPDLERLAAVLGKKGDAIGSELDNYIQPRLRKSAQNR